MKARVVVTMKCNRNCENCCNTEEVFKQHRVINDWTELLNYDEVIITGGEPMLIPDKVLELSRRLRDSSYKGKIYMYSAYYNRSISAYYERILNTIDGLHYTLHFESKDKDIIELKQITEDIVRFNHNSSFRLAIDSRLYDKYDFSNIDLKYWGVVRKLKWIVNCDLPKDEELLILEL